MLSTGPQISAPFVLTGPDGTRVAFNNAADPDYIGMLRDVTGLDSPDVRESADDLVQMDGGIHGDFFYGRRPVTLTGLLLNPASADERNQRMTSLMRASNAMRADAILSWTLEGGEAQFLSVRRQQPLRITGAWQKEFQLAVVAADPRIYSTALHQEDVVPGADGLGGFSSPLTSPLTSSAPVSGQVMVDNQGSAQSPALLVINGPCTNPRVINFTTGEELVLTYTLGEAEFLVIDMLNRTVLLNNSASRYGAVDFNATSWWWLEPGENDIRFAPSSYSLGCTLEIHFRDAWL